MVLVYVPRYDRQDYCQSEYAAMEALEKKRLPLLGRPELGLIVPIILRGKVASMPKSITGRRHFCDFTGYTLKTRDISRAYAKEIDEVAKYIGEELFLEFQKLKTDPCSDCDDVRLPADSGNLQPLGGDRVGYPGREADR
jgi:hypothetical protein